MKKSCWLEHTLSGPLCCSGLLTLEERGNKEREMSGDYDVFMLVDILDSPLTRAMDLELLDWLCIN